MTEPERQPLAVLVPGIQPLPEKKKTKSKLLRWSVYVKTAWHDQTAVRKSWCACAQPHMLPTWHIPSRSACTCLCMWQCSLPVNNANKNSGVLGRIFGLVGCDTQRHSHQLTNHLYAIWGLTWSCAAGRVWDVGQPPSVRSFPRLERMRWTVWKLKGYAM